MKKIFSALLVIITLLNVAIPNAYASGKSDIRIKGLATSISKSCNYEITDKINIYPYKNVTIKLQCYNRDKKCWVTQKTVKVKKGEITLKYPDEWKNHLVSYWRIYCPRTKTTNAYTSPEITIANKKKKQLGLNSKSAVIMEKNSHLVLYSKNKNTERPMASTTKLMTALLTLEHCKMDEIVTIKTEAPKTKFGILDLKTGDRYRANQLLTALLIPSANDSAVALGEHISGSTNEFVRLMNERARELGLENTHYTSPFGLDNPSHYSSAYDISIIHSMLLDYKDFLKIEKQNSCHISDIDKTNLKSFETTNKLNKSYNNLISGKTGTTTNARYCFSGAYKYKGTIYVFTILGADNDPDRWDDCKKIISYIRANA